jgi:hypothetical protein
VREDHGAAGAHPRQPRRLSGRGSACWRYRLLFAVLRHRGGGKTERQRSELEINYCDASMFPKPFPTVSPDRLTVLMKDRSSVAMNCFRSYAAMPFEDRKKPSQKASATLTVRGRIVLDLWMNFFRRACGKEGQRCPDLLFPIAVGADIIGECSLDS